MPIFCQLNLEFGKRYKNDVRVIFDQWPKQNIGFDVEPEIRILKVMESLCTAYYIYICTYVRQVVTYVEK